MGTTTKEIGSSSFNDMISSVDRRSEYVENRAGANVRLNNFLTPYTLDSKSSILNAPCGYSNGVYASLRPSDALGPELVTNGDLETSGSITTTSYSLGYVVGNSNDLGVSIVNNALVLDRPSGTNTDYARVYLTNGTNTSFFPTSLSGKKLKLQFEIKSKSGQIDIKYFNNGYVNIGDLDIGIHTIDFVKEGSSIFVLKNDGLNSSMTIDNVSIKEDTSADFDFTRGTAATRVTKDGLVKDVQILSDDLVKNGNFDEIGSEEVSNGDFSQEGSELVVNGGFDTDSDWIKGAGWTISGGKATVTNSTVNSIYQDILDTSKIYKATFEITDITSGSLRIGIGTNSSDYFTQVGTYTYYGKPTDGKLRINPSSGTNASIDNVSVVEVGQDWTFASGWSIEDGKAVSDGTINTSISQSNVFTIGKSYKVTISVNDVVGNLDARFWMGTGGDKINISSQGDYTAYWKADGTDILITTLSGNTATYSTTNISVKEVGQNWSFGTGWSMGDGKAISTNSTNSNLENDSISIANGKQYKFTFEITDFTGNGFVRPQLGAVGAVVGTYVQGNGVYSQILIANNNFDRIVLRTGGGDGFNGSIDNISVIEITDDTNLPRIDYTNGTGALLLEPQSTNLITYSEDFSNYTQVTGTITADSTTSPDGTLNASVFNALVGLANFYTRFAATVGLSYAQSIFLKKGTRNWVAFVKSAGS